MVCSILWILIFYYSICLIFFLSLDIALNNVLTAVVLSMYWALIFFKLFKLTEYEKEILYMNINVVYFSYIMLYKFPSQPGYHI
jgi:hypothetical protein